MHLIWDKMPQRGKAEREIFPLRVNDSFLQGDTLEEKCVFKDDCRCSCLQLR